MRADDILNEFKKAKGLNEATTCHVCGGTGKIPCPTIGNAIDPDRQSSGDAELVGEPEQ